MNILLTGATGLIGKAIGKKLAEKGHNLFVITRNQRRAQEQLPFPATVISGDLSKSPIMDSRLENIEAVIHLAGEPVAASRWNAETKKRIYNSRVRGTENLLKSLSQIPKVILSGSAIGYYGDRGNENLTESSKAGDGFLAHVCVDWERVLDQISCRKVFMRTGVVLALEGGALPKMLFPFRVGVGGVLGSGEQWMSWIHIEDVVNIYIWALENDKAQGVYNVTSPNPVKNDFFSKTLAKVLGRPLGFPLPTFVLKMLFGEMSQVILASQKVLTEKLQQQGFEFSHPHLEKSLQEICEPYIQGEEEFYAEQFVAATPENIFSFFSEAKNLEKITPETLNFRIQNISTPKISEGTLIDYKLNIHGVSAKWRTAIKEWQPPYKFVDDQLKGPYKLWHHTHEFRPFAGGTLLTDRVRYKLPLGYLGWLVAGGFVRQDIQKIFSFRKSFIAKNWPSS